MVTSKVIMKQANIRFNYHDYLQLPEDKRYEILDGELFVVPAPSIRHQRVAIRMQSRAFLSMWNKSVSANCLRLHATFCFRTRMCFSRTFCLFPKNASG